MEKYFFKCYSCGAKEKGKMTICKQESDPNRNDEYGKEGYSNCCWKEACLKKIGKENYFKKIVEFEFFDKKGNKVVFDDN